MRRYLFLPVLLVVLLAGTGVAYLTALPDREPLADPQPRPHRSLTSPAPSLQPTPSDPVSPAAAPTSSTLTYVRGTQVVSRKLGSDIERTIVDLHTGDVVASPTSQWIAYVMAQGGPGGEEGDFVRRPELHLHDLKSGEDVNLGAGFAPSWSPSGTELAFLRPDRIRKCDGETCSVTSRVMIGNTDGSNRSISDPGRWHVLVWAGGRILVSDEEDTGHTVSMSVEGADQFSLPVPPDQVWDSAPDGSALITAVPGKVTFTGLVAGQISGSSRSLDLGDAILSDGSWSVGSGRIAAVVRDPGGSHLVLLSENGAPLIVPGSQGAMGNVVWNAGGDGFVYVSVAADDPGHLEARGCRVVSELEISCQPLFRWTQGITLLRLLSAAP